MSDILIETLHSDNSEWQVFHNDSVVLSRCYPVFMRSLAESLENGHVQFGKPWFDIKCGVIFIVANADIIGHLVYGDESTGVLSIVNMAGDEQGVYSALLSSFEKIGISKNCWAITASVDISNQQAVDAAHDVGLKDIYYQLCKKL